MQRQFACLLQLALLNVPGSLGSYAVLLYISQYVYLPCSSSVPFLTISHVSTVNQRQMTHYKRSLHHSTMTDACNALVLTYVATLQFSTKNVSPSSYFPPYTRIATECVAFQQLLPHLPQLMKPSSFWKLPKASYASKPKISTGTVELETRP